MEYDVEVPEGAGLLHALENYLVRCKHCLHDEALVEHYEILYQNNILYYHKILALLRQTLTSSRAKADRVTEVIANDGILKEGILLEIEGARRKCEEADTHISQLIEQKGRVAAAVEEREAAEALLLRCLEQSAESVSAMESQAMLARYALAKAESEAEAVEKSIVAEEHSLSSKRRELQLLDNVRRMLVAELEDVGHLHSIEVEQMAQNNAQLNDERVAADREYNELARRRDETKAHVANLMEIKLSLEETLDEMMKHTNLRNSKIETLKEELKKLTITIAAELEQLTAATEDNKRMKDDEIARAGRITALKNEIDAAQRANNDLRASIQTQETLMKEIETSYNEKKEALELTSTEHSETTAACNALRMQLDEQVTMFRVRSASQLQAAEKLHSPQAAKPYGSMGFQDLRQLERALQLRLAQLETAEVEISQRIDATTLELHQIIGENEALTKETATAEKHCEILQDEIAQLREEMARLGSKEDSRSRMKVDLLNEREYIQKAIKELRAKEEESKAEHTRQLEASVDSHKARLQRLRDGDSEELAEIIDEETRNSDILLNAALDSLELDHTKERSKLEARFDALVLEEKGRVDAIHKVNSIEISRLRGLVEAQRNKMREAAASAASAAAAAKPEETPRTPAPKDINVHFKTPTLGSTPGSSLEPKPVPAPAIKKEPRRKCIRRGATSSNNEGQGTGGKDELDLFC